MGDRLDWFVFQFEAWKMEQNRGPKLGAMV